LHPAEGAQTWDASLWPNPFRARRRVATIRLLMKLWRGNCQAGVFTGLTEIPLSVNGLQKAGVVQW
ncbi:MAG: hypothetical protein ACK4OE_23420, partial [Acidovorax sp.]|uniref:hypothetical protein n=1 Tax=Acidovorax sp. TaxID=1872122 RepID=UPI00391A2BB3